jgi:hypothetical protein
MSEVRSRFASGARGGRFLSQNVRANSHQHTMTT